MRKGDRPKRWQFWRAIRSGFLSRKAMCRASEVSVGDWKELSLLPSSGIGAVNSVEWNVYLLGKYSAEVDPPQNQSIIIGAVSLAYLRQPDEPAFHQLRNTKRVHIRPHEILPVISPINLRPSLAIQRTLNYPRCQ
jgi:hypothetical protein